jgi:S1-C subfamily serine protease
MVMRAAFLLAAMAIAAVPVAAQAQVASDDWLPSQQHGIGFAKDPSGAIVTKVAKGSAAERAGVLEGMVITHIDGLPLRELSTTQIARIFAGSGAKLDLKIRGSGTLTVNESGGMGSGQSSFNMGSSEDRRFGGY